MSDIVSDAAVRIQLARMPHNELIRQAAQWRRQYLEALETLSDLHADKVTTRAKGRKAQAALEEPWTCIIPGCTAVLTPGNAFCRPCLARDPLRKVR